METHISSSERETIRYGEQFAGRLKPGDVVCLYGGLGAGKTHFAKGLAAGLGVPAEEVHSPTFTLIHEYSGDLPVYHFDCYRVESWEEMAELGAEEYFHGDGVSVIEWPERIEEILPAHAIRIEITASSPSVRKFVITHKSR